jgi:hypothetical protein
MTAQLTARQSACVVLGWPAVRPVRESIERGSAGLLVLVVAAWYEEGPSAGIRRHPPPGGSLRWTRSPHRECPISPRLRS